MKRISIILLIMLAMILLCSCGKTSVDEHSEVTVTFVYEDRNISVTLEAEEAEKVKDILTGNSYHSFFSGIPSCGFSENISMKVGKRVFAIACDTCNCIQDLSNLKYVDIPTEDMKYIHALFEEYGGYFPCV